LDDSKQKTMKPLGSCLLSYSNWNGVGCFAMYHFVREFYSYEDDVIWTLNEWLYE
jgi:hypothetical protein